MPNGSIKYQRYPDYRTYLRILSPVTPEPALDAGHGAPGAGARDVTEPEPRERCGHRDGGVGAVTTLTDITPGAQGVSDSIV